MKPITRKCHFYLTKANKQMLEEVYPEILAEIISLRKHCERNERRYCESKKALLNFKIEVLPIIDESSLMIASFAEKSKEYKRKYFVALAGFFVMLFATFLLLADKHF